MKATKLDEVFRYFKKTPLTINELGEYYVNPTKGRGKDPIIKLKRKIEEEPEGNMNFLFAGYRGCGKTTELSRLQKELQGSYLIINFSVFRELDPNDLNYIEIFFVAMDELFKLAKREDIHIDEGYLRSAKSWVTKEMSEINDLYVGVDTEAGTDLNFLTLFFSKFKLAAKASKSLKEELKQKVEPKLSQLIDNCNLLITEVKNKLHEKHKKGIIFIIEDLDKLLLEVAENLFYHHSPQITQLNVHTIFTYPISLLYHNQFNYIKNQFHMVYELPMIKVRNADGTENADGIQVMTDIVAHRMELSLFETPDVLKKMILTSGGCLRDLFQLIGDAADNAIDFGDKIRQTDSQKAYYLLRSDYYKNISDKIIDNEVIVSVEEYYTALVDVVKNPTHEPNNTRAVLDLRQNLCVLGYNDTQWFDVHPVVKDILTEKGRI